MREVGKTEVGVRWKFLKYWAQARDEVLHAARKEGPENITHCLLPGLQEGAQAEGWCTSCSFVRATKFWDRKREAEGGSLDRS